MMIMSRTALFWIGLAIATGLTAAPATGAAQCRLCDAPTTELEQGTDGGSVSLEIETSLDFDRLVLIGSGEGSATLRPDGSQSVNGTIAAISGRAMVGRAVVRGEPGRSIRIDLPDSIDLHSISGGRLAIDGARDARAMFACAAIPALTLERSRCYRPSCRPTGQRARAPTGKARSPTMPMQNGRGRG
jgi:hypothetical protein